MLNLPAVTFQATSGTLVPIRENPTTPGESTCSCISRLSHMHTRIHPLTLKHHCCATPQERREAPRSDLCCRGTPHAAPGAARTPPKRSSTQESWQQTHPCEDSPSHTGLRLFLLCSKQFLLPCKQTAGFENEAVGEKQRGAPSCCPLGINITRTKHKTLC